MNDQVKQSDRQCSYRREDIWEEGRRKGGGGMKEWRAASGDDEWRKASLSLLDDLSDPKEART